MSKAADRKEKMIGVLRHWQGLERQAIDQTTEIMQETDNMLIRQIMEIIRNDSVQHHRVQQFIVDSMTKEALFLSREDMADVFGRLEEHDKLERETIELAKELIAESTDPVHTLLLTYLVRDEEKHDQLLCGLNELKAHLAKLA